MKTKRALRPASMSSIIAGTFLSCLCFLLTLLFSYQIHNSPLFPVFVAQPVIAFALLIILTCIILILLLGKESTASITFIICILCLPALSPIVFRAIFPLIVFILFMRSYSFENATYKQEHQNFLFLIPLFFLSLGASLRTILSHVDTDLLLQNIYYGSAQYALPRTMIALGASLEPVQITLEILLLCMFPILLSHSMRNLQDYLPSGITISIFINSAWMLAQYLHLHPLFLVQQSAFWEYTGRLSGTFSDPNAAGVMLSLCFATLLFIALRLNASQSTQRTATLLLCFACILATGSRTSLGITIVALICYFLYYRRRPSKSALLYSILIVLCVSAVSLYLNFGAVTRLLATCNPETSSEMLKSRLIFWRLALEAIQQSPLLGHGFGQFYQLQTEFANAIGISLGSWRDNTNSLYLQITSEAGILGCIVFFLSLGLIYMHSKCSELKANKVALLLFLIAGVIGPHYLFAEVRVFIFFLLSLILISTSKNPETIYKKTTYSVIAISIFYVCLVFLLTHSQLALKAFHGQEYTEGFELTRWSSQDSKIILNDKIDLRTIVLKNASPNSQNIRLCMDETQCKNVSMPPSDSAEFQIESDVATISIHTSPLWSPKEIGLSPDIRLLGVQVLAR